VPDLRLAWQVRKGMSCFLLVNEGRSGLNFSLDCQMEGYPEIWHPWSGERQAIAQTRPEPGLIRMHLHLESLESQFILFGRNPPERMPRKGVKLLPSLTSPNRACVGMKKAISGKAGGKCFHIDLSSGWHFRFHDQAAGRELPGLPEWRFLRPEEPFSGAGTYQRTFTIRTLPANTMASLDLGQVREVAKVWLNGHLIDVLFWPPYRLDASYALKAGENDIRVEVMNNICCRMDQVWKPSGLLGPVRLHFGERED
jgi:hypothetical protein